MNRSKPDESQFDARIERLLKERPDLVEAATLQRALVHECHQGEPAVRAPILLPVRVRHKLSAGEPLLHRELIDPDSGFCRDLFGRLLNLLQMRPVSADAALNIATATATGRLDFERVLGESLADHQDHLAEVARWAGVEPDMLASILNVVCGPALQQLAAALRPLLTDLPSWGQGYCPICGAWPGLAELQLSEQQRHLRCLRCGADWPSLRLLCPFCGNDDHESLGYLQVERELRYRVEVCERCKGYLKSVNTFEPNPPQYLSLEDLASIHLDLCALERGYNRPEHSGFRLELGEPEPDEQLDDILGLDP